MILMTLKRPLTTIAIRIKVNPVRKRRRLLTKRTVKERVRKSVGRYVMPMMNYQRKPRKMKKIRKTGKMMGPSLCLTKEKSRKKRELMRRMTRKMSIPMMTKRKRIRRVKKAMIKPLLRAGSYSEHSLII